MAFTYFFRDISILEGAVNKLMPFIAGKSKIKVWDAGCAMGPEPYSLAIILAEKMGRFAFKNLSISATDIDGSNLFEKIIKDGIYRKEELGRVPSEIMKKYFTSINIEKTNFQIESSLRQKIKYSKHDLLSLQPIDNKFSFILCKNVLLHFNYAQRIEVIKMFHASLDENGIFATEQTQKIPEEISELFELILPNAQVFKKVTKQ